MEAPSPSPPPPPPKGPSSSSAVAAAEAAHYFIGSLIYLVSKSDMRYQGILFHLDPLESVIALRDVKSFGTEGRRKDGPQIPPSDQVYDYIYFRGSDIKDLQVISSSPVQGMPAVPNDPAIIQSHYPSTPSAFTNETSAGTAPVTNFGSHRQFGVPVSTVQGNLPLYQSVENSGYRGSSSSPIANGNGLDMPTYWPGITASSGGNYQLQQQPLPPQPKSLVPSTPVQQTTKHPKMDSPLVGGALNFVEDSLSSLPPVHTNSPYSASNMPPAPAFQSKLPIGQSSRPTSGLSPDLKPNNEPSAFPSVKLGTSSSSLSSLATNWNVNAVVPPISGKPRSVLDPTLSYQTTPQSMSSVVASTTAPLGKESIQSHVTRGQLFQPGLVIPSSRSLQKAREDIETMQAWTTEPPLSYSENAQEQGHQLPSPSAEKLNGADVPSHHNNRHHSQGRRNRPNRAALQTHRSIRGHGCERGKGHNGAAPHTYYNYSRHAMGRGNELNGAALHPRHSNRAHFWGRSNRPNGAPLRTRGYYGDPGQGIGTKMPPTVTKFTEDFDFEAMNKKFNKEAVWGVLGKSKKSGLEDKGDQNASDKNDVEMKTGDGLPYLEKKPVYQKDEFFDSFSRNSLDHESGRGKMKMVEQIDTETFGAFQRHRRGLGIQSQWSSRARESQGSYRGRGYACAGRGRGQAVWYRVT